MSRISIERPLPEDQPRIGALIYTVDPYIYPPLFGTPKTAEELMPALAAIPNSPFAPEHILIARLDGEVAGVSVYYSEPFAETPVLTEFCSCNPKLPDSCQDVCERYLIPMCAEVGLCEVYIACIATDARHRNRGVATALFKSLFEVANGKRIALDVLKDNHAAISLYEKLGFEVVSETIGYAYGETAPKVYRMVMACSN